MGFAPPATTQRATPGWQPQTGAIMGTPLKAGPGDVQQPNQTQSGGGYAEAPGTSGQDAQGSYTVDQNGQRVYQPIARSMNVPGAPTKPIDPGMIGPPLISPPAQFPGSDAPSRGLLDKVAPGAGSSEVSPQAVPPTGSGGDQSSLAAQIQALIGNSAGGSTSGAAATSPTTPSYLADLFPGGIPQGAVSTSEGGGDIGAPNLPGMIQQAAGQIPQVGTSDVRTQSTASALGGIPTAQAGAVNSRDVLGRLGLPQIDPGKVQAGSTYGQLGSASYDPQNVLAQSILGKMGGSLDPGALTSAVRADMQPEFARENRALTESLANAGIVGGSTSGAVGDLAQQQERTLAAQMAPFEQTATGQRLAGATSDASNDLSASGQNAAQQAAARQFQLGTDRSTLSADQQRALAAAQGNQNAGLSAQQTAEQLKYGTGTSDASRALAAAQGNQGTQADLSKFNVSSLTGITQADLQRMMQADTTNAGNRLSSSGANAGNAIGVGSSYAQQIMDAMKTNQSMRQQNSQYNAGALNSGNQFNVSNLLNSAQYDTGSANQMLASILGMQNQDWLAQLGVNTQLASGAAGGTAGAYQPVFSQPAPVNFGGLAGAFGANAGGGSGGGYAAPGYSTAGKAA